VLRANHIEWVAEETSGSSDDRRIPVNVSTLEWGITIGVTVAVLLFDIVIIAVRPHEPSFRECAIALTVYVGLAVAFGLFGWQPHGGDSGL
jgi:tellurite resistance protein TerC